MTNASELRELETRSQRYWTIDGLPELVMGLVWLITGGAQLLMVSLKPSLWLALLSLVVPAALVLIGLGSRWFVERLKLRITYPRTGYVALGGPSRRAWILAAGIAILSAAALAAMILTGRAAGMEQVISPVTGVLLGLAFLLLSLLQRAPHLLALAGVALALAAAFTVLKLGWLSLGWLFLGLGLAASIVGAWRLRRYLAAHPRELRA